MAAPSTPLTAEVPHGHSPNTQVPVGVPEPSSGTANAVAIGRPGGACTGDVRARARDGSSRVFSRGYPQLTSPRGLDCQQAITRGYPTHWPYTRHGFKAGERQITHRLRQTGPSTRHTYNPKRAIAPRLGKRWGVPMGDGLLREVLNIASARWLALVSSRGPWVAITRRRTTGLTTAAMRI
jgi:hypothetical protein